MFIALGSLFENGSKFGFYVLQASNRHYLDDRAQKQITIYLGFTSIFFCHIFQKTFKQWSRAFIDFTADLKIFILGTFIVAWLLNSFEKWPIVSISHMILSSVGRQSPLSKIVGDFQVADAILYILYGKDGCHYSSSVGLLSCEMHRKQFLLTPKRWLIGVFGTRSVGGA